MARPPAADLDRVYAAPDTSPEIDALAARTAASKLRGRAAILLGLSIASFAVGAVFIGGSRSFGVVFLVAGALAAAGAAHGVVALLKGVSGSAGALAAFGSFGLGAANVFMALLGALTAYLSTMTFTRGRQIRSFGRILLPPIEKGVAWTTKATTDEVALAEETKRLGEPTRVALAAQWRENGRTEHASVAAFARLTLDLVALGAPPELIAGAQRDALDEVRHAELCFSLARALDGVAEGPGAFPAAAKARTLSTTRIVALSELAVDSLVDGALHEGVSARIVAKLARRCADPAIASMMKEIAADEGRHSRHGWDVVKWCLAEGGEPVARALAGAMKMLPETMASPIPAEARAGGWERFGIMGEALEAEEHHAARADLERRVRELVAQAGKGKLSVGFVGTTSSNLRMSSWSRPSLSSDRMSAGRLPNSTSVGM